MASAKIKRSDERHDNVFGGGKHPFILNALQMPRVPVAQSYFQCAVKETPIPSHWTASEEEGTKIIPKLPYCFFYSS
jgi:hypothetical protein